VATRSETIGRGLSRQRSRQSFQEPPQELAKCSHPDRWWVRPEEEHLPPPSTFAPGECVPFASGEHPDLLLLIGSREVEPCHVGAGVDLSLSELEGILTP